MGKSHVDDHKGVDREILLGRRDTSQDFKDLTPEESEAKIRETIKNADSDYDGRVSLQELQQWLSIEARRYLSESADKKWNSFNLVEGQKLSFDEYKAKMSGDGEEEEAESVAREERRLARADRDGDKMVSREELLDLLYPEESENMRDVVVQETLEQFDQNKNGLVEMEEFIGDMWVQEQEGDMEPEWVEVERKEFREKMDINGDGVVDKTELGNWSLPKHDMNIAIEANHIMEHADTNKDGFLTVEEIQEKRDLFEESDHADLAYDLEGHTEL